MAGLFRELILKDPRLPGREKDENGKILPKRSSEWPKKRKAWLKSHPKCEGCGKEANELLAEWTMQVHHNDPFHLFPERELDEDNYTTLCGNTRCHLGDGHNGDFKKWNPFLKEMLLLRKMIRAASPKTREYSVDSFIDLAIKATEWLKVIKQEGGRGSGDRLS